jgi:hypothetical protein
VGVAHVAGDVDLAADVRSDAPSRLTCTLVSSGLTYSAVVSLSNRRPSDSGMIDCTVPLPNERLPTITARA